MKSYVFRMILTLVVAAFLGGCSDLGGWHSWFTKNNVAQKGDEAPPPDAAPAEPVEVAALSPPPASGPPPPQLSPAQSSVQAQTLPSPASQFTTAPAPSVHTKVAILLPLSGKNATLGQAMLNAAQIAVFDMSGGNFELMPRDTANTEATAAAAARDAISSGAQLLIGPLFAAQVPGVKAVAEQAGINVLTLSTDTSFAAPGLYVMGFAPGAQVERVVNYTAMQNLKRFAALVPDNAYGALVGQAFQLAVARNGGTVIDIESYNPAQHGVGKAIVALAAKQGQIDALFLPEGGDDLEKIAGQLAAAGFDSHHTHMLGTGLWDEGNLGQHVSLLIGGWYAASDPALRRNFMAAYMHAYGQEPPRLATLSYDATALAAVLARRGARFDRTSLTNPNGFSGVDGIFRLTADGLVERGLAVNEVMPNENRVIASAPSTFAAGK